MTTTLRRLAVVAALLGSLAAAAAMARVPFWGDKVSQAAETLAAALKDGQWVWAAGEAPQGPILVVANLDQQLGYVCRNGVLIGWTTISTGKKGDDTHIGVFHTLQKDR